MSFYDEQLKIQSGEVSLGEGESRTEEVHLDDEQLAASLLDWVFDEFRTMTEWPENKLKFSEPGRPLNYKLNPSEILTPMKDEARGATAVFICGNQTVEELITIRCIESGRFEMKFGPETMTFCLTEMPCCPPFAPGIVISMIGAKLIMGVLQMSFLKMRFPNSGL